jgi:hypothetical protein
MHTELRNYKTQGLPKTTTLIASQQFYGYPPGLESIESITIDVGGINYPVDILSSQKQWDFYNQTQFIGFTIPKFIFPRKDDFGIYPIPESTYTLTFNGHYTPKDLTFEDYDEGTASVTQNTLSITGSGAAFTPNMVGKYIQFATDGEDYKIAAYVSSSELSLANYYEGNSQSGAEYRIFESPELPTELHEYIPHRAASKFYCGPRRDTSMAQAHLNYFFTGDYTNPNRDPRLVSGGFLGFKYRYDAMGRSASGLAKRLVQTPLNYNEAWISTITS